ncbi:MAG: hypothetical protein IKN45_03590, partial [Lachnospiraceae bacterium]|nr:hypothetical protein [Lachnospiraceae bacterium]
MDKKKIFLIVESVLCFIIAAFFAISALIIYNKGLAVKAAPDGQGELVLNAADKSACGAELIKAANARLNGQLKL